MSPRRVHVLYLFASLLPLTGRCAREHSKKKNTHTQLIFSLVALSSYGVFALGPKQRNQFVRWEHFNWLMSFFSLFFNIAFITNDACLSLNAFSVHEHCSLLKTNEMHFYTEYTAFESTFFNIRSFHLVGEVARLENGDAVCMTDERCRWSSTSRL